VAEVMTYNSLVANLLEYAEQSETSNTLLQDQIPQIISRAQISLANRLKIQGYRDIVVGSVTPQSRVLIKPTGWRNTITFVLRTNNANSTTFPIRRILRARSFELINLISPDTTSFDTPRYYTDYNLDNWLLGPTPDQAYPFEITMYRLPQMLGPDVQTNYLTEFIPNALLFQCLLYLAPYLNNDNRIPTWTIMLKSELEGLNADEMAKIADRAQTRNTQ
jgi:hypothetical protein